MNGRARRFRSALYTIAFISLSGLAGCLGGGGGGSDGTSTASSSGANGAPIVSGTAATPAPGAPGAGVTLSWTAPTENIDGTPLTNLAGYVIAYGSTAEALTQSISLDNPSIDRYVFDQLTSGTYFFAIKAINSEGTESDLSSIVSRSVS